MRRVIVLHKLISIKKLILIKIKMHLGILGLSDDDDIGSMCGGNTTTKQYEDFDMLDDGVGGVEIADEAKFASTSDDLINNEDDESGDVVEKLSRPSSTVSLSTPTTSVDAVRKADLSITSQKMKKLQNKTWSIHQSLEQLCSSLKG